MNVKKKMMMVVMAVLASAFLMSFIPQDQKQGGPWEIPAKYKKMENPYAGEDLTKIGKMMWSKHCKSCHGNVGLGDGPKAKQLETLAGDFSTADFQGQADGVMYYKSFVGRDEMPNFEKKIPDDEDRWAIIAYMKTFGK